MNVWQSMVLIFHEEMGLEWAERPTHPPLTEDAIMRRLNLIFEEAGELNDALNTWDEIGAIDALCDLIYVALGTAVEMGVDLEPFFKEVHRSNMTKVGGHKREDGKWVKPDSYTPADLERIYEELYG